MHRHGRLASPSAFSSSRRGAAIIVVVGLLAILFIAAVAFTELMRVERSASSNYRHMVGARQMLYAGLAQALADIDGEVTNGGVANLYYPPWSRRTVSIGSRTVTLENELLQSIDRTALDDGSVARARVISIETEKYLPRNVVAVLHDVNVDRPEWVGVNANGSLIGRYAYVAVNVSGLLDANEVAKTNRWMGVTPGEIAITNLNDVGDLTAFQEARTKAVSFETLKDLSENNNTDSSPAGGLYTNELVYFETYSY